MEHNDEILGLHNWATPRLLDLLSKLSLSWNCHEAALEPEKIQDSLVPKFNLQDSTYKSHQMVGS